MRRIGIADRGSRIVGGAANACRCPDSRSSILDPRSSILNPQSSRGFTLVEMIMVIVITGIIGGMVAVFLNAPIRQYMDVARRAEMTDIADTALRRINRDLRLALPNSVRVAGACDGVGTCFVEFLPTSGGGRYRAGAGGTDDELDFAAADATFEVLGAMPTVAAGDRIVVYNLGIPGADAYAGDNIATAAAPAAPIVNLAPAFLFPFDSPGRRFHVVTTPVTYACDGAGTLWRYWGYAIQDVQTKTDSIAELDGLIAVQGARARLATNVSGCRFVYDGNVVAQRSGLVTMHLAITEDGEAVTLYSAAHVSNQP
jgi:MSHA biogenesis protein MshO